MSVWGVSESEIWAEGPLSRFGFALESCGHSCSGRSSPCSRPGAHDGERIPESVAGDETGTFQGETVVGRGSIS
jgi:hypothetical protein